MNITIIYKNGAVVCNKFTSIINERFPSDNIKFNLNTTLRIIKHIRKPVCIKKSSKVIIYLYCDEF